EASREYLKLANEADAEATYSSDGAASTVERDVSIALAEKQHTIDVTSAQNAARGTEALANATYLSANYERKVTALDELVNGMNNLAWAQFEQDRAQANADAWDELKDVYLEWQTQASSANATYTLTRANANYATAEQNAGIVAGYEQTVASRTYEHVGDL